MFYVCDSCGLLTVQEAVPEDGEWTCGNCGSHSVWEFPPERRESAKRHAAHITRGIGSGIFRSASRASSVGDDAA